MVFQEVPYRRDKRSMYEGQAEAMFDRYPFESIPGPRSTTEVRSTGTSAKGPARPDGLDFFASHTRREHHPDARRQRVLSGGGGRNLPHLTNFCIKMDVERSNHLGQTGLSEGVPSEDILVSVIFVSAGYLEGRLLPSGRRKDRGRHPVAGGPRPGRLRQRDFAPRAFARFAFWRSTNCSVYAARTHIQRVSSSSGQSPTRFTLVLIHAHL